jgi:[amino group carrier protein]-lysine/ornithine hydrolase
MSKRRVSTVELPGVSHPNLASIQALVDLVNINSPSGEETEAVNYLVDRMRHLNYRRAFIDPAGNAVGWVGDGPHQIVLLGHIDTVPGVIPVRVEGDLLYGRGSVDAKGSLSAFVEAAAKVKMAEGWQIVVIGAVDEEGNSAGARACLDRYRPAFVVIGEPSGWSRLTLGYKGSAQAGLILRREVLHNAAAQQSACEDAFQAWNSIKVWAEHFNYGRRRVFDQVSPSLRRLASGSDGLEEWAQLEIDTRLPTDLPPCDWYRLLNNLFPQENIEPGGFCVPAYSGAKNNRLVRNFLKAIRNAGGVPGFVLKSGTSDMNVVAPVWDCPTLAYGPGDSTLDHTPDEHISLNEYIVAVGVLVNVLDSIVQNDERWMNNIPVV